MKPVKRFLAFDLGASNGRAVVGEFDGSRLECRDIHHFPNRPVAVHDSLHWDVLSLFAEIKNGLREYVRLYGSEVDGIGVDTWGVDFGLFDRNGKLLGNPHHYRDKRNEGMREAIYAIVPEREILRATGVRLQWFTTLCQFMALVREGSAQLEAAELFLMMPSIFHYFLTGVKTDEHANLSDTAMLDFSTGKPVYGLLEKLGIPARVIPPFVMPGTVIGEVLPSVREEVGLTRARVIAPPSHDTASAVTSVPATGDRPWAFLSTGTWCILGIEADRPLTSEEAYQTGVTSAATAAGKYMPRINVTGLWFVQELKRIWELRGESYSYDDLVRLAESASPFAGFIDPDHPAFVAPPDMEKAIASHLKETGQKAPEDKGTLIRLVLESLALKYRYVLERIEKMTGRKIEVLHMMGGGVNNRLLCQFTSDSLGIPVLAGPVEATSSGNLLVQMVGAGLFGSVAEGREALRASYDLVEYHPKDPDRWSEAYSRYRAIFTEFHRV